MLERWLRKSMMKIEVEKGEAMTLTFKRIVESDGNLEKYKEEYAEKITKTQLEEVEKMLECRNAKKAKRQKSPKCQKVYPSMMSI